MESKQQREQAFPDAAFTDATRARVWGFYKNTGNSRRAFREMLISEGLPGKRVLSMDPGRVPRPSFSRPMVLKSPG